MDIQTDFEMDIRYIHRFVLQNLEWVSIVLKEIDYVQL
jgi:hypothetical protein